MNPEQEIINAFEKYISSTTKVLHMRGTFYVDDTLNLYNSFKAGWLSQKGKNNSKVEVVDVRNMSPVEAVRIVEEFKRKSMENSG